MRQTNPLRAPLRAAGRAARWLPWAAALLMASASEGAESNKAAVAAAFEAWSAGEGSPFDLLQADATWTILGPTPTAGVYTLPRLREEILEPFQARLATPLKPSLRALYEDGDTVIALFEASARLKSGDGYRNSYAWFFEFEAGKARAVVAVLDLHAFDAVMTRSGSG